MILVKNYIDICIMVLVIITELMIFVFDQYRGKSSIYQLVKDVINNDLPSGLRQVINVAASATVIGVIFFILV